MKIKKLLLVTRFDKLRFNDLHSLMDLKKAARECQSSMITAGSPSKRSWANRWGTSISKGMAEQSIFPVLLIPPTQG